MRSLLLGCLCLAVMAYSVYLSSSQQPGEVAVKIQLLDADTGKPVAGMVRVLGTDRAAAQTLPGMYSRVQGLGKNAPGKGWYVVPEKGATTTLPQGLWIAEAFSGLETAVVVQSLDCRKDKLHDLTLKVKFLYQPKDQKLVSGNTHLHLRNMTLPQAEEYLRTIPPADALQVLFISYLERAKDDADYITNKYPVGDLKQFDVTGVLINNGEEHRHNFKAYGQGYGHVMFLDINKLVKPVSLGPGITEAGFDDLPLRTGIDEAKKQGGTVLWCHNTFGYEDVLNALTGRLDALNVFDGSRKDTYEDTYYHYLNIGLRLPLTTGTDWFMYDFSRVYAKVPGKLTIKSWLDAVKAGRCQATNGPLLSLTVNGQEPGDIINLAKAKSVQIEAKVLGRHGYGYLELVQNGKVIKKLLAQKQGDAFTAEISAKVPVDTPSWFAVRVSGTGKNELEQPLFAHTSPVYVDLEGRKCFSVESGKTLLQMVEEAQDAIRLAGKFSSPQAKDNLLKLYDDAKQDLTKRINQQK